MHAAVEQLRSGATDSSKNKNDTFNFVDAPDDWFAGVAGLLPAIGKHRPAASLSSELEADVQATLSESACVALHYLPACFRLNVYMHVPSLHSAIPVSQTIAACRARAAGALAECGPLADEATAVLQRR